MFEKKVVQAMLSFWRKGAFTVRFWDGEEKKYGEGEPKFKLIFYRAPKLKDAKNVANGPVMMLGEAYMDGAIGFEGSFDDIIKTMFMNEPEYEKKYDLPKLRKKMFEGAEIQERENIHSHYDIGNDFYRQWLDETMSYSCAYFKEPGDTLHQAQLNKIDLALKKLNLKPGEKLLDIGCGWGWLIIRAAQQYGVEAVGITLSVEQYKGAKKRISEAGLADKADVRLCNYMDLDPKQEQFDKVVSIGMFEHVGKEFLPLYMQKVNSLMKEGGAFLLHSIMGYEEGPTNEWIKTYIFPGGYVPTVRETVNLFPDFNFYLLHMESLRRHYALTLEEWRKNFNAIKDNLPEKYDDRFKRMWELYLAGCAAAFRTGNIDVVQYLLTKGVNNDWPMNNEYIYQDQ